jgi:hypothetical protein
MCVCVHECARICVSKSVCAFVSRGCAGTLVARRGPAVSIARLRGWRRVRFALSHPSFAGVAAGATWRLVIAHAQWAARGGHTTVIDAAGAIYVLGGHYSKYPVANTFFNDVWVSTDGGADRTRAVLKGGPKVYRGVPRTFYWQLKGYSSVIKEYQRVLKVLTMNSGVV